MSVASSRHPPHSVGQYSRHTPPGSAFSGHRSHHSSQYEHEASQSQAKSVARSAAPVHSDVGRRLQAEIPPPPESVISFAGPEVDPSDSVSQVGSRASRSTARLSHLRAPQEGTGTHRSQSASARSQASSAKLTAANLSAHNANPQTSANAQQEADNQSQAKSGHTARQSQYAKSAAANESHGSQKAPSAAPSKASTAKPSQRGDGNASQAPSRASTQKQATHVSAYEVQEEHRSQASFHGGSRASHASAYEVKEEHRSETSFHGGSRASHAAPSHASSKGHNAEEDQSDSDDSGPQQSHHSSKAPSAAPSQSHSGSKVQHGEEVHEEVDVRNVTEEQVELRTPKSESHRNERRVYRDGYSPSSLRKAITFEPERRKLALVYHRPKRVERVVREPLYRDRPLREPIYRELPYREPVYRERAFREPALRSYDSDPEVLERRHDTYTVEVEQDDEQVSETKFTIKRRHEYRVQD